MAAQRSGASRFDTLEAKRKQLREIVQKLASAKPAMSADTRHALEVKAAEIRADLGDK